MRIRYETKADDIVAFNHYYMKNAPEIKRNNRKSFILFGAVIAGLFLLNLLSGTGYALTGFLALYMALIVGLMKWLIPSVVKKRVRRMYSGESGRGFIGAHTMEIRDDCIIHRSEYHESKIAWGMIQRIESTPTHTFLFLGKSQGYTIPHNALMEGSLPAFLKTLGESYKPDAKLPESDVLFEAPNRNLL